jgi:hypothetical protein
MYHNLRQEMTLKSISVVQISKWFQISRQAVHRKLNGSTKGITSSTSPIMMPSTTFNGFQKPKTNKKKPIEEILELNEVKS